MLAMHTMRVLNGLANIALSASMTSGILALRALHFPANLSILLNTHRASRNFFSGGSNRFSGNRRHSMGLETDRAWLGVAGTTFKKNGTGFQFFYYILMGFQFFKDRRSVEIDG
jgi:hypothetical protein